MLQRYCGYKKVEPGNEGMPYLSAIQNPHVALLLALNMLLKETYWPRQLRLDVVSLRQLITLRHFVHCMMSRDTHIRPFEKIQAVLLRKARHPSCRRVSTICVTGA